MTNSAIKPYPIKPIADLAIDAQLAAAVLRSLADYHQQLLGRRIWLACSGGRDSLALAALCVQLYQQDRLPFLPQLLHVDHGLQVDSSIWASHVADWAAAQQLSCTILKAQVQGQDEQAARQARYRVMREYINQGDVLMLAHHADDQAETVLMRLIQGAGIKGLAAMQPWREHLHQHQSQQGQHYALWRPWLTVTRAAISDYAKQLQLPYIDDPTNASGDNVRSGLRRDIMPKLVSYNANVIGNVARSAQLLSEAQAIVEAQAEQDLQTTAIKSLEFASVQRVLAIDKLHDLSTPRQKQLLYYWLAQDEPLPPSKQLIDDVYALTQRQDNDHQTELDWHAHLQHYRIYRFRQHLYRLSRDFVDWLASATLEHRYDLSKSLAVDIRKSRDTGYLWQLQIDLTKADIRADRELYQELIDNETSLKITPLDRLRKVQTTTMGRAQAGKKLYQTLAIPVWLRSSLVVVSAVVTDTDMSNENSADTKVEVPLLLLSPFQSWTLKSDLSSNNLADTLTLLSEACINALQKVRKP